MRSSCALANCSPLWTTGYRRGFGRHQPHQPALRRQPPHAGCPVGWDERAARASACGFRSLQGAVCRDIRECHAAECIRCARCATARQESATYLTTAAVHAPPASAASAGPTTTTVLDAGVIGNSPALVACMALHSDAALRLCIYGVPMLLSKTRLASTLSLLDELAGLEQCVHGMNSTLQLIQTQVRHACCNTQCAKTAC